MALLRSGVALHFVLLLATHLLMTDAKKCPADETRSLNDPNNLYDCPKDATCCFENGQPSCCTPKEMNEAVKDQMKLWGGLAAILFVIIIVVLTCRRDIEVCKEGTVCCPCCCKPKPHPDDGQETPIISDQRGKNMGPPDFTAPGVKPQEPQRNVASDHLHPAPVAQVQPAMVAAPPPPPPPPRTAGFAPIMDMADDDDDEFRF